jgi:translation initiation factor 2B subunit (eIF-2B alpha/beta/delta family)
MEKMINSWELDTTLMMNNLQNELENILKDNVSGSSAIIKNVLSYLKNIADDRNLLRYAISEILKVHGDMVILAKTLKEINSAQKEVEKLIERKITEISIKSAATSKHLAEYLQKGDKITILSRSHIVENGLIEAKKKLGCVYVLESRPMLEGIHTAKFLKSHGIKVKVMVDAAMGYAVKRSSKVIMGADGIYRDGIVNKIGSFPLSLMAKYYGNDVIIVAPTIKLIDRKAPQITSMKDPKEVSKEVKAENYYFEFVPANLISGVITESGFVKWSSLFASE